MADIYAVTWDENLLKLLRVSSEGVWRADTPPVKSVQIQRPTRPVRWDSPEAGGHLADAIAELFRDVDLNIPCWMLLPPGWAYRFQTELPELKSQDQTVAQLRWEIEQRLAHESSNYRFVAALMPGGQKWFICVVQNEVIGRLVHSAKTNEIEISGIGLQPQNGDNYSFEHPLDLRDGLAVEPPSGPVSLAKKKVSPAILVIFGVVVIGITAYLLSLSSSSSPPASTTPPAPNYHQTAVKEAPLPGVAATTPPTDTAHAIVAAIPTHSTPPPAESIPAPATPAAKPVAPPVQAPAVAQVTVGESPIRALFHSLPKGASVQLIVISPVDIKVEVTGGQAEEVLKIVKSQPGWGAVSLADKYNLDAGPAAALRLAPSGWRGSSSTSSPDWVKAAKAAGLNPRGKTASGKLEAVLGLTDRLWKDASGVAKIYIAPQGSDWVITVQ